MGATNNTVHSSCRRGTILILSTANEGKKTSKMSNLPHSVTHATQYEDVDSQKKSSGVVSYLVGFEGQWRSSIPTRLLVHSLRGSSLCLFFLARVSPSPGSWSVVDKKLLHAAALCSECTIHSCHIMPCLAKRSLMMFFSILFLC